MLPNITKLGKKITEAGIGTGIGIVVGTSGVNDIVFGAGVAPAAIAPRILIGCFGIANILTIIFELLPIFKFALTLALALTFLLFQLFML